MDITLIYSQTFTALRIEYQFEVEGSKILHGRTLVYF